jgi:PAS domain-containing protein
MQHATTKSGARGRRRPGAGVSVSATPGRAGELESQIQALRLQLDERRGVEEALRSSEDAVRRSEVRMRHVLDSALHGLVVVDRAGRIEMVNRQIEAMSATGARSCSEAP